MKLLRFGWTEFIDEHHPQVEIHYSLKKDATSYGSVLMYSIQIPEHTFEPQN
jgi:hypothetical protein